MKTISSLVQHFQSKLGSWPSSKYYRRLEKGLPGGKHSTFYGKIFLSTCSRWDFSAKSNIFLSTYQMLHYLKWTRWQTGKYYARLEVCLTGTNTLISLSTLELAPVETSQPSLTFASKVETYKMLPALPANVKQGFKYLWGTNTGASVTWRKSFIRLAPTGWRPGVWGRFRRPPSGWGRSLRRCSAPGWEACPLDSEKNDIFWTFKIQQET